MTTPGASERLSPTGPSRAELLGRARDLAPIFRERAARCEQARRLIDENEKDLHDSGLFKIHQPARVGGFELDFAMVVDVGAEIARGCVSTAWNLCNFSSHHWMLGMFPPQGQDDVWDTEPDALIASGLAFPSGRARRAEGGYVVSGTWGFSSGVDNATWNIVAAMVQDENDAPPEPRFFLLDKSQYEVIDTWYAMGLAGTGSKDITAEEVFVPAHRTLALDDIKDGPTPGSAVNPGPLYRMASLSLFSYVLNGVLLGAAQGAYDDYVGTTRDRVASYSGARVGDFQSTHIKIAKAGAMIDAAARLVRFNCDEAMGYAERNETPDTETKYRYRRDGAHAAQQCNEAVAMLFAATGAGGIYERNAIQRTFRDSQAAIAHITLNFDVAGAAYGRAVLGLPPTGPAL